MLACGPITTEGRRHHGPIQAACFCQSGNSYKVALYLNCAGLDWEPVFVDFMNGATREPKWRESVNEMGEAPVLDVGAQEADAVGRHPDLPRRQDRQVRAGDRRRAPRGAALDPVRQPQVHQLLRHLPVPASRWRRRRPDPAVLAFLKGRFDGALGIVEKHLAKSKFMVGDRPTIADFSLAGYMFFPVEETRLRLGQEPSQHPRLDRAHARAARLEGPLRADAGRAHQAAEVRTVADGDRDATDRALRHHASGHLGADGRDRRRQAGGSRVERRRPRLPGRRLQPTTTAGSSASSPPPATRRSAAGSSPGRCARTRAAGLR